MSNRSFITFEQAAPPLLTDGVEDGDLWLQPVTGTLSKYSSGAWTAYTFYDPTTAGRGVFGGGSQTNAIDYISIATPANAVSFGSLTTKKTTLAASSNGTTGRGVFGGGYTGTSALNNTAAIEYITILTLGNGTNFGNLSVANEFLSGTSNGTSNRGVFGGGFTRTTNLPLSNIENITISTPANAQYYGALTLARYSLSATSNGTNNRGVFFGGQDDVSLALNTIDYITISNGGTATLFGSLLTLRTSGPAATSNGTNNRGIIGGGYDNAGTNFTSIEYITISTTGNATTFGQSTGSLQQSGATSNGTDNRGVFSGGFTNIIDYVSINTLGNATAFGQLTSSRNQLAACSNS